MSCNQLESHLDFVALGQRLGRTGDALRELLQRVAQRFRIWIIGKTTQSTLGTQLEGCVPIEHERTQKLAVGTGHASARLRVLDPVLDPLLVRAIAQAVAQPDAQLGVVRLVLFDELACRRIRSSSRFWSACSVSSERLRGDSSIDVN